MNSEHDTCKDNLTDSRRYTLQGNVFSYKHSRELPNEVGQHAIKYIRVLVQRYPFQLRYHMALPFWYRFSEAWCATGDEGKALRAI